MPNPKEPGHGSAHFVWCFLQHLALPLTPTQLGHADTVVFDVTGELMPSWVEGVDPEPEADARAPPTDWDGIDPPAPDD